MKHLYKDPASLYTQWHSETDEESRELLYAAWLRSQPTIEQLHAQPLSPLPDGWAVAREVVGRQY